ncbi:MAG: glycine-rich protein [Chloroflexia bacterium]
MKRRTWGWRGALIALLAILSIAATGFGGIAPTTRAADGPQSVTFNCLGAPQYFSVPPGVTSITVSARGASGRNGNNDSPGLGATIQGTMTVVPGQTYTIAVGCTTSYGWANGGAGGDASTGLGSNGANGGGATGIVLDGTPTPVLVAGGGGGSGGGGGLVATPAARAATPASPPGTAAAAPG